MMRVQTARMLTLLRDAVDHELKPETVEVRALVEEIVSIANARRQATVTMPPGAPRWLRTHPAALWRAVANVVDNAVRAAGPDGRVEISIHDRPPQVVIEVVDDGPGFGNAPAGTASLGLRIVAALTRHCDGRVKVLPVHPHGVRVRLEFRDLEFRDAEFRDAENVQP
jgi:signal transduction histidine kinase